MNKEYKALAVLSARLAESILMDWDKEEVIKLAKEVAVACHENIEFISLVKKMREAQIEAETCMHEDYDLCVERVDKADRLEIEVDELLKKMEV